MAQINPDKLIKNLKVTPVNEGELRLNWDIPVDLSDTEELVVVRRKDAFPVEIRNRNFEDRYTDVAQVEVFRGSPIYCSQLNVTGPNTLEVDGSNTFTPVMTEFSRDNKYTGRLIRDSRSQVFRITNNTDVEIEFENISTNPDDQAVPTSGPFVILADFPSSRSAIQTVPLLTNAFTLTILTNSFSIGDKITINNTEELFYGSEWAAGATAADTLLSIKNAITTSGINYRTTIYGSTLLIEKNTEDTLAVSTNSANIEVVNYAAARGKIFTQDNVYSYNELRYRVLQDGDVNYSFISGNSGKLIETYTDTLAPNADVYVLDTFTNTYPSGYIDTYKSFSEALLRSGTGLETDVFYYYTVFTTSLTSVSITYNEEDLGGENPLPYTVDQVAPYYMRIFYESINYTNNDAGSYTYDEVSGDITFTDGRDLSEEDIEVGYLFADSLGQRFTIINVSNLASGSFKIAVGQTVGVEPQNPLHGSVTTSQTPIGFGSIQVGDTFKDIAGNSFRIEGTSANPISGLTTPPSNSFDISQGLIDTTITLNPLLVNFSYDPSTGIIQYGEKVITQNNQLSPFSYNSISGIVTYTTNINLNEVEINQYFVDGAGNQFQIRDVDANLLEITLDPLLTVNNTVSTRRDGSVIDKEGYTDVDGTPLIDLTSVQEFDLFKTNSKSTFVISDVDTELGTVTISQDLDTISLIVETEFDASVVRRGAEVSWVGFENENLPILDSSNLGAVRRYNSVNNVQFSYISSDLSTQAFAISARDNGIAELLYKMWPSVFRDLDATGDLEDLMNTFGHELNEIYSKITTFELNNTRIVNPSILSKGYNQYGIDQVSETLGIDTRRRMMQDLVSCWSLKGSREGIFKFIKVLTTWDITNGTGDVIGAITDFTPDTTGLRHYSPSLGDLNTQIVDTADVQSPPAGRFVKGVPGISLSGFFEQVEIQIELPNVALYTGISTDISYFNGDTLFKDSTANFGQTNSLVGCYVLPLEGNPNDFYEITANDSDTLTVAGGLPISVLGGKYVILSPLNLNRFVSLQANIQEQLPYNAVPVFNFTIKTI